MGVGDNDKSEATAPKPAARAIPFKFTSTRGLEEWFLLNGKDRNGILNSRLIYNNISMEIIGLIQNELGESPVI
jgi:hypothetical protein